MGAAHDGQLCAHRCNAGIIGQLYLLALRVVLSTDFVQFAEAASCPQPGVQNAMCIFCQFSCVVESDIRISNDFVSDCVSLILVSCCCPLSLRELFDVSPPLEVSCVFLWFFLIVD